MITRYGLTIGAMKAGATILFDRHARRPQVTGSNPGQPGFFAFDDVDRPGCDGHPGRFSFDPDSQGIALDASTHDVNFPHCRDVPDNWGIKP